MKILITGGHFGPAMAVIAEIGNSAQVIFVGKKYDVYGKKAFSLEYQEIAKKNIEFYNLQTGRLTRLLSIRLLTNILKIPLGIYQALAILTKEKPNLILSFGGYIALPICLIASVMRIPILIHEQTIEPGITNRLIGRLAKKIFVTFADSRKYFPRAKTVVSGNPIRKNVLSIQKKPFGLIKNKPVIYFTGGSLGSHSVNIQVEKILPEILSKYIVVHQAGNIAEYGDYQRLLSKRNKLPKDLKESYYIRDRFFTDELGYIYSVADLVVGRSGANTLFELIALKKPAIFIPLPWSAGQEQLKHAQLFQKAGVGEIFDQSQDSKHLVKLIDKVLANIDYYKNNFKKLELLYKENAAKVIAQTIHSQLYS